MSKSEYKPNYEGVGALLQSDFMQAEMLRRAVVIAAIARLSAAVGEAGPPEYDPHPGRYRDRFTVSATSRGGRKHDRAEGLVVDTAPEAVYNEFGTFDDGAEGRHTLLNALLEGARDAVH